MNDVAEKYRTTECRTSRASARSSGRTRLSSCRRATSVHAGPAAGADAIARSDWLSGSNARLPGGMVASLTATLRSRLADRRRSICPAPGTSQARHGARQNRAPPFRGEYPLRCGDVASTEPDRASAEYDQSAAHASSVVRVSVRLTIHADALTDTSSVSRIRKVAQAEHAAAMRKVGAFLQHRFGQHQRRRRKKPQQHAPSRRTPRTTGSSRTAPACNRRARALRRARSARGSRLPRVLIHHAPIPLPTPIANSNAPSRDIPGRARHRLDVLIAGDVQHAAGKPHRCKRDQADANGSTTAHDAPARRRPRPR